MTNLNQWIGWRLRCALLETFWRKACQVSLTRLDNWAYSPVCCYDLGLGTRWSALGNVRNGEGKVMFTISNDWILKWAPTIMQDKTFLVTLRLVTIESMGFSPRLKATSCWIHGIPPHLCSSVEVVKFYYEKNLYTKIRNCYSRMFLQWVVSVYIYENE